MYLRYLKWTPARMMTRMGAEHGCCWRATTAALASAAPWRSPDCFGADG